MLALTLLSGVHANAQPAAEVREAVSEDVEWGRVLASQLPQPTRPAVLLAFLRATHLRASAAHRRGDTTEAADIAAAFLFDIPVQADVVGEHYTIGASAVPATPRTTRVLNDLAFYLVEDPSDNETLHGAADLLGQIVERAPTRAAAVLNLADASWRLGLRRDASDLYRRYRGLRSRVPPRVLSRIHAPERAPEEGERIVDGGVEETRVVRALGTLSGGVVTVSAVTTPSTSGYSDYDVGLLWRSGADRVSQRVTSGTGYFHAPQLRASRDGDQLVVRYPETLGRFQDTATVSERWAFRDRRFERVSRTVTPPPYVRGQRRFAEAARTGDLERMRGIRARIGTSGTGGHTDDGWEMAWTVARTRLVTARRDARRRLQIVRYTLNELAEERTASDDNGGATDVSEPDREHLRWMIDVVRTGGDEALASRTATWLED